MHQHLRHDVLRLVWATTSAAGTEHELPPNDLRSHAAVYSVVVAEHVKLPPELEQEFARGLLDQLGCDDHDCRATSSGVGATVDARTTQPAPSGSRAVGTIELDIRGSLDLAQRQLLIDLGTVACCLADEVSLQTDGVDFVDCAGIGSLVEIARFARRRGTGVRLDRRSPAVQQFLDLLDLDPSLDQSRGPRLQESVR